ncbi:MAG: phenylalanine--tRNA ligase subunit beta [Candidatus Eremiobacteraeota bacterium]|nr:phenylalanine--tRNA ligase subunit beta [Candidatus Eremiobacteraeota bacterium]
MRVPIAWLRDYVDLPENAQAIADRLAMLGFPVDAIEARPLITGVIAGTIVELQKHPNADRLQVGKVDVGADAPLTIATAATNVAVGQRIAVATIGAQLPLLRIERRKMRGVESEGMMCSADELALPAEWFEDGILQLDADVAPGTDIVKHFRLADAVLDVDVTSNRPDALSMVGLARELAAATGAALRAPSDVNPGNAAAPAGSAPVVTLESPDCLRFVAQRFENVRVDVAPTWIRVRLALAGQRPINNLVDISNFAMLETGQPLHFYDDARITNHHLIVRDAREGEKMTTLDDVEHVLSPLVLVVADEAQAQCLAGLKGGKASEVGATTTAIVLEAANFAGARVRRASVKLGFRTDASSRHEKSLAPALTDIGAARAAQLLVAIGATAYAPHPFGEPLAAATPISFPVRDVKRLLGFELPNETIATHLRALGCSVAILDAGHLDVTPPAWRRDIAIGADIVEEIARMAGYDNVVASMPAVFPHDISSRPYRLERKLAYSLAALGYNEIASYALHGPGLFAKTRRAGLTPSHPSVEIRNPLSEDQRYLRYALGPGLIEYFARVGRLVRVFEIGHAFTTVEGLVEEAALLSFGFAAEPKEGPEGTDSSFLRLKGDAIALIRMVTGRFPETTRDVRNAMHPGKTAVLMLDGREVAALGQIDPRIGPAFGTDAPIYVCNMYLDALPDYRTPRYAAPSKFPSTYRDLALVVALDVEADAVQTTVAKAVGDLCTGVRVFDEYRGRQVGEGMKSLAVRITLQHRDATITDAEADAAITRALEALRERLDAVIRT